MGARIKDIAEKAQVSVATVSLVLNNKPGVSGQTRQKILGIARELNYDIQRGHGLVRNGTIRFLKIAKHGHTVNRDHDVFIADYIDGLDHEAKSAGYSLEINTFKTGEISTVTKTIESSPVDGVIVLGTELNYGDVKSFEYLETPIVFIDTFYDYLSFSFVDMNNIDSVCQIVGNFYQNGHREIGFIGTPVEVNNFRQREIGFRRALKHFDIPYDESRVYSVDSTFDGAYEDMSSVLRKNPKLPTALFATNDIIAYGCIKAIKEAGYSVPDDVSIIGFDDLPMSAVMDPPLTTMEVSKRRIGQLSMTLMNSMLKTDPDLPPAKITICGRLICRKSVKNLSEAPTGTRA
jgi:LacI family transcriptional regulator